MTGALKNVPFATDPVFGLSVPTACPDVPSEVLMPRNTWTDRAAYDATAAKLKGMFDAEAKKYT
jgi:phosphoenolpyruvate carboxykinase (ATP)